MTTTTTTTTPFTDDVARTFGVFDAPDSIDVRRRVRFVTVFSFVGFCFLVCFFRANDHASSREYIVTLFKIYVF